MNGGFRMEFKVGVGKSDFADLRNAGNYYVDKTEILYELVHETDNKVTLFTRPRRFGKTLMMSMMENFFHINKDSREIFDGLRITRYKEFCDEWMNRYPVLFISFKDIEAENFSDAYDMLKARLADVCKKMAGLERNDRVNQFDAETFVRLQAQTGNAADVKNSLKMIMRMMHAAYGREVILLIDEYDVPLAKASTKRASEKDTTGNRFYASMLDLVRGIMGIALKDNEYLKFAVITGCLRIAKESIFTGTNNFASYSVLDEDFSGYFGFLDYEVAELLKAADREDKSDVIKEWYDGYIFGNSCVYCPWDVTNYVAALRKRNNAAPKNYWKNTSHNGILLTFVNRTDFRVNSKFETLLNGGVISQTISDELTYDTLHASEDNLWSVILMTGYLTKANPGEVGETVELKIPNREIATIFEDTVVSYFKNTIDNSVQKTMMDALWSRDEKEASRAISDLLWKTISYNDYHEDYYHAFLAGAFVGLGYEVESNKEKGLGRPDILLKDDDNRRAIIIEAKKSDYESDMEAECKEAIDQIITKKYAEGLCGYRQVICYGIAFFQKQAMVKNLSERLNF
ncbi:MAG: ATP-binding protein [Lachnospiraceae bacterium]|nr:ATP-binding protein [Lachnospiraceae bacterium]